MTSLPSPPVFPATRMRKHESRETMQLAYDKLSSVTFGFKSAFWVDRTCPYQLHCVGAIRPYWDHLLQSCFGQVFCLLFRLALWTFCSMSGLHKHLFLVSVASLTNHHKSHRESKDCLTSANFARWIASIN